jgi:hypothetical protein
LNASDLKLNLYLPHSFVPTKEPKTPGWEKRAKAVSIPLKEINAPSLGLQGSHQSCGMISILTLHYATFFTLFSLRPNWKKTSG